VISIGATTPIRFEQTNWRLRHLQIPTTPATAPEAFKDADCFYATSFHELGHWSGHKSRLDRDLTNRFGNRAYAAEELVAELASAFLCAEFGINKEVRHASYIANWIELLRADDRAFFTAASQAQKAADYLRGLALTESLLETVA